MNYKCGAWVGIFLDYAIIAKWTAHCEQIDFKEIITYSEMNAHAQIPTCSYNQYNHTHK